MSPIASTIDRYAVSAQRSVCGAVTVGDSDRGRCCEQFNAMTTAHDVADTYRPMWDAVTAEGSVGVMGSYNAVGSSSPHSDPVPVKLPHHCWHLGFRSSKSAGNIIVADRSARTSSCSTPCSDGKTTRHASPGKSRWLSQTAMPSRTSSHTSKPTSCDDHRSD